MQGQEELYNLYYVNYVSMDEDLADQTGKHRAPALG